MGAAPSGEGGLVGALPTLGEEEKAKVVAALMDLSTRGMARIGGCEATKRFAEFREETIHVPNSCKRLKVGGGWASPTAIDVGLSAIMCGDGEALLRSRHPAGCPAQQSDWHPLAIDVPCGESKVRVGCGWHCMGDVDVDLSALMFDGGSDEQPLYSLDNNRKKKCPGARHSGDNQRGQGDGDAELIELTLSEVPLTVERIIFTVTLFQSGVLFQDLDSIWYSLSLGGRQVGKYVLSAPPATNGCIFAELRRTPGGWAFVSANEFRGGCKFWTDLRDAMRAYRLGTKRAGDALAPAAKRVRRDAGS